MLFKKSGSGGDEGRAVHGFPKLQAPAWSSLLVASIPGSRFQHALGGECKLHGKQGLSCNLQDSCRIARPTKSGPEFYNSLLKNTLDGKGAALAPS